MLADRKSHFEKTTDGDLISRDVIGNQVSILEWVLGAEIRGPFLETPDSERRMLGGSPWPDCSL